jgi:prephenate dehydrogenase
VERITIIGTGLIGSSIGLALKKSHIKNLQIMGHDREPTNASAARKRGAVDETSFNLPSSVRGAKLVIIATPVLAIRDVMEVIGPDLEPGTLVTDTGSTKSQVLKWAEELLPDGVHFVGGHPMAGKEQPGPEAADADLFEGAVYAICPDPRAPKAATESIVSLAEIIGATPYFVDPSEHDSFVAAVSHLPFLLSISLVASTSNSPGWREISRMAASGYRDISRLASGDPMMHRDICITNREQILHWTDECIKQLYDMRNMIQDNPEELEKLFISAWEARAKWMAGVVGKDSSSTKLPSVSMSLGSMFLGEPIAKRIQGPQTPDDSDPTNYRKS